MHCNHIGLKNRKIDVVRYTTFTLYNPSENIVKLCATRAEQRELIQVAGQVGEAKHL